MKHLFLLLLTALGMLAGCSQAPLHHTADNPVKPTPAGNVKAGLACIAPNIYVDPAMPEQHRQVFLQRVTQSKAEIARFFGDIQSSPDIFACVTKECFSQFGGIPARAKSIGDHTVILSAQGVDKITLTHELAHIELHKRLGSPHIWNKLPMWFDEGLAVMICKDPRYTGHTPNNSSGEPVALQNLVSQDQWVDAIRDNQPAYSVSRQAVEAWYQGAGTQGLHEIITRMKQGKAFSLHSGSNKQKTLAVSRL